MRLFTALWPPAEVVDALDAEVGDAPPDWRLIAPSAWHVTLAFHGEADPGVLAGRLDAAVRGASVPRLCLAGAGAFDGVRWAGVEVEGSLDGLVTAVGGDVARFVPHLTLLRVHPRPGPGGGNRCGHCMVHTRGPLVAALRGAPRRERVRPRERPVPRRAPGARAGRVRLSEG